jgi:hypothetical protein
MTRPRQLVFKTEAELRRRLKQLHRMLRKWEREASTPGACRR